jgi:quercetin dioxygenase-like cupin family protein
MVSTGTWSRPGHGDSFWFLGTLAIIRVPGDATDGRFALIEFLLPRNASPPLHTHPQDESYVLLDGEMTIKAGDERYELVADAIAVVPAGVPHTFRVDSGTARTLVLSTPAGIEGFVREGGVPAERLTLPPADTPRPTPERMAEIFVSHEMITVGPPLGPDD